MILTSTKVLRISIQIQIQRCSSLNSFRRTHSPLLPPKKQYTHIFQIFQIKKHFFFLKTFFNRNYVHFSYNSACSANFKLLILFIHSLLNKITINFNFSGNYLDLCFSYRKTIKLSKTG